MTVNLHFIFSCSLDNLWWYAAPYIWICHTIFWAFPPSTYCEVEYPEWFFWREEIWAWIVVFLKMESMQSASLMICLLHLHLCSVATFDGFDENAAHKISIFHQISRHLATYLFYQIILKYFNIFNISWHWPDDSWQWAPFSFSPIILKYYNWAPYSFYQIILKYFHISSDILTLGSTLIWPDNPEIFPYFIRYFDIGLHIDSNNSMRFCLYL